MRLDGLEDGEGADDVDLRSEDGVGAAGGHLQAGKVDDVGDAVLSDGEFEVVQIGHVALVKANLRHHLRRHDEMQASVVLLEVVDPGSITAFQKFANDPGTNTAVTAGQQHMHESALNIKK